MQRSPEHVAGVTEGQILAGKYRIEHCIAVGGMGAVVAAHHLQLDTRVAIKFLRPDMLANEEAVARFAREARALAKITNEHVARVFDVGTLDNGGSYMVMEFLHGCDLGAFLQEHGPLEPEVAIGFVLEACEAVGEAHSRGIIHRDLKPSNLFCTKLTEGRQIIKVLDFGISKLTTLAALEPNITQLHASSVMGSPPYMSPEQMEGGPTVDARTDIWALGVILYELLTGKPPFCGETLLEISVKIATRRPPPLRDSRADASEELQAVIFRCLEKDLDKRYASVVDLAIALLPFASEEAAASVRRIIDVAKPRASTQRWRRRFSAPSETIPPVGSTPRAPAGGKKTMILIAAAAAASAPLAFFLAVTSRKSPSAGELSHAGAMATATIARSTALAAATASPNESAPPAAAATSPPNQSAPSAAAATSPPNESAPPRSTASPLLVASKDQGARSDRATVAPTNAATAFAVAPKPALPGSSAATPALTAANCDPNFYFDAQGRKHFKSECWASPAPSGVASAAAKADCDPNFYLDAQGRKHFKPECFLNHGR